jgi:hypothetical protein
MDMSKEQYERVTCFNTQNVSAFPALCTHISLDNKFKTQPCMLPNMYKPCNIIQPTVIDRGTRSPNPNPYDV